MSTLASGVRSLLDRLAGDGHGAAVAPLQARLDAPMTIAVAGMVKAGKSTLVNAILGERVAPTDAGECTRIVTHYRHGTTHDVRATVRGSDRSLGFSREGGLHVDLAGLDPSQVDHLSVTTPNRRLLDLTLVDTPGLASLSQDVAARTRSFLTDAGQAHVDAVVYLLRHRHPTDTSFLESFHGGVATAGPVHALGVLSRPDELAGGAPDAMEVAARVASSMAADARLRRLCQSVLPVHGLLAETATTLRHAEDADVRALAAVPGVDELLLTVDRVRAGFGGGRVGADALLERFGMYGLRAAVGAVRAGQADTRDALSNLLAEISGIGGLRRRIREQFGARTDVLRARAVLAAVSSHPQLSADAEVAATVERLWASPELAEMAAVERLRSGPVPSLPESDAAALARLLGADGHDIDERLGAPGAPTDELRAAAVDALERWQRLAEHPLGAPEAVQLARLGVRACETMLLGPLRR